MPLLDFTTLKPKDTFQYLMQISSSELGTGTGTSVKNLAITSSFSETSSYSVEHLTNLFLTTSLSSSWASSSISSSYSPMDSGYSASVSVYFGTKQNTLVGGIEYAITTSLSKTSSYAVTSSNTTTSSFAHTSSYIATSSYSSTSSISTTSSFAHISSNAITSSFTDSSSYSNVSVKVFGRLTFIPPSPTSSIDFDGNMFYSASVTASMYLTASNPGVGKMASIRLDASSVQNWNIYYPQSWVWIGNAPTGISASKTAVISLTAFGNDDRDIIGVFGTQL